MQSLRSGDALPLAALVVLVMRMAERIDSLGRRSIFPSLFHPAGQLVVL